jgi:phage terminase large subunit
MSKFRSDPLYWVEVLFGDAIKLTDQQSNYFIHLSNMVRVKQKIASGKELTEHEKKLYACKMGISIMAGRGVGKDFSAALTVLWFLMCFANNEGCRVLATGVTATHLRNVLWAEISKLMGMSKPVKQTDGSVKGLLFEIFDWQVSRLQHKGYEVVFAEAVTINKNASGTEQTQALSGRHAPYMLVICDEMAGIPDVVLESLEATLTGAVNIAIGIFNPVTANCYAVKNWNREGRWLSMRWNGEKSPIVTRELIESQKKYGEDSNPYRVNILGKPPLADQNTLIPPDWVQQAIDSDDVEADGAAPTIAGVDVGRGGDRSVVIIRQGGVVEHIATNQSADLMIVAEWVHGLMTAWSVDNGYVDVGGVGAGVYDRLCQLRPNCTPVVAQGESCNKSRYFNKRSEMFMRLRDAFQNRTIRIPRNEDLVNELTTLMYEPEKKCQVLSKKEIRKKLGFSPDLADALALTYSFEPSYLEDDEDRYADSYSNSGRSAIGGY